MTGILNCLIGTFRPSGLVIGEAYEGGFYAGQISTTGNGVATHNLVVSPKSSGDTNLRWKPTNTATSGADSAIDGPQNSIDMDADGSAAANFCETATIGGFSDWYLPARNELEVCYYNLKPTTTSNNTSSGANSNAVPSRSNYTSSVPAQTSATAFQTGGAEAFDSTNYWTSTEHNDEAGKSQSFSNGIQSFYNKNSFRRVRAIRRVAV